MIRDRLVQFLKHEGLSHGRFEKLTGLSNGYVNNLRDNMRSTSLDKITESYPKLNKFWLLTGQGEMLIDEKIHEKREEKSTLNEKEKGSFATRLITPDNVTSARLISQYAYAGYLSGYNDTEYMENQPVYVAVRKYSEGNYVAFEIRGDSMCGGEKPICNGDVILVRELYREHWKSKIRIPKVFIIVHKTDGILCKEITGHDVEKGVIACHSFNPEYEDFELSLENVVKLFYIKEQRVDW